MIALLVGRLVHKAVDRVEVETSGGIGYELHVPLSVFGALPAEGETVTLFTHLAVREDAWELYGFASRFERAVFRRLLVAKGVGPALALGVLSALSAERVVTALRERDVTTLIRAPRVGKRKAEQIILDLADKVDDLAGGSAPAARTSGASGLNDAVRALMSLGYAEAEADRAVRSVGAAGDVTTVVRAALAELNG